MWIEPCFGFTILKIIAINVFQYWVLILTTKIHCFVWKYTLKNLSNIEILLSLLIHVFLFQYIPVFVEKLSCCCVKKISMQCNSVGKFLSLHPSLLIREPIGHLKGCKTQKYLIDIHTDEKFNLNNLMKNRSKIQIVIVHIKVIRLIYFY